MIYLKCKVIIDMVSEMLKNIFFEKFTKKKERLPIFINGRENLSFKIPSLFCNDEIMFELIDACSDLGIKLPVNQVFGSVKSTWSGGRYSKIKNIDFDLVSETIKKYNKNGIGCSFTFSNYHVDKTMLDDVAGNKLLEIASEYHNNYAIISSDILRDYIKSKYPKIKLQASLLKPTYEFRDFSETPSYYDDLCDLYDKVCLRPELGQNLSFLKKLKHKDKIEVLVNSNCVFKCPFSVSHYDRTIKLEESDIVESSLMCNSRYLDIKSMHNNNYLSNKEIDKIIKLGFNNFKIAGRNVSSAMFLMFLGTYIFDSSGVYQYIINYMNLKKVFEKKN